MDTEKLITALRKARVYIRSVEAWRNEFQSKYDLEQLLECWTEGDEIKAIEDALGELGVWV